MNEDKSPYYKDPEVRARIDEQLRIMNSANAQLMGTDSTKHDMKEFIRIEMLCMQAIKAMDLKFYMSIWPDEE